MEITREQSKIIQGIAILMMVMHHLWGWPIRTPEIQLNHLEEFLGQACKICVSMYIFITGYGLSKKMGGGRYILGKILKTYTLYWKVFVIFVTIGLAIGYYSFDIKECILNFTAVDVSYNREWWYIFTYINFLLITPLVGRIRSLRISIVCFAVLIAVSLVIEYTLTSNSWISRTLYTDCHYIGVFLIGILLGRTDLPPMPTNFKRYSDNRYIRITRWRN